MIVGTLFRHKDLTKIRLFPGSQMTEVMEHFNVRVDKWIDSNLPQKIANDEGLRHQVIMLLNIPGAASGASDQTLNPQRHMDHLDLDTMISINRLIEAGIERPEVEKIVRQAFSDPETTDPIPTQVQEFLD